MHINIGLFSALMVDPGITQTPDGTVDVLITPSVVTEGSPVSIRCLNRLNSSRAVKDNADNVLNA